MVNNISHQRMVDVDRDGKSYLLPYALARAAAQATFPETLIIGAGSGNDVEAALVSGAKTVDGVEIDPLINLIGQFDHPNQPFQQTDKVTVHYDDGRSFLKTTPKTYDLVTYGLVDSLVLHSGYSSLRLESYLFTQQAIQDIKKVLKPTGTLVMCNYYRQGWVVGRLEQMVREVFGTEPLVISLPMLKEIGAEETNLQRFTFVIAGMPENTIVPAIRERFARDQSFWLHPNPAVNRALDAFGPSPPAAAGSVVGGVTIGQDDWLHIAPATVKITPDQLGPIPTDDWPFLYLREAYIPNLNLSWMGMIVILSLLILVGVAPIRQARPNGQMFFLGAGFMLLETKGVVHLALLFGSTWMVNSIVFFAILVMVLISNLFVLTFKPKQAWPYLLLLALGLLVNVLVPVDTFLSLPGFSKVIASCAVVFLPIAFAGILFAMAFRDSTQPDADFGWNIAGVILGGISESFSMMFGFNALIWIAIAYYALSAILRPKGRAALA